MKQGAVILCGGKSTRMGTAKALLPFGPELMLQRIVRLVSSIVAIESIAVVSASGQTLPPLPQGVLLTHDAREDRGPLEGLAAGMKLLEKKVQAVYVTSCDVPLLEPAFVSKMFGLIGDHEIVVPRDGKFYHPLAAVYRVSVLAHIRQLLADNRLRPFFLFEKQNTLEIPIEQMRDVDPQLATLENLNRPEEYHKALRQAGYEATGA